MDRIQRRPRVSSAPPPTGASLAPQKPTPSPPSASVERGSSTLGPQTLSILKQLPRTKLIPESPPKLSSTTRLPAMSLGAFRIDFGAISAAEKSEARTEKDRSFALVDILARAGFPAISKLREALPVKTKIVDSLEQEGADGLYDAERQTIRLFRRDEAQLLKLDPRDPNSYTQASKAIGTFFHEAFHHRQQHMVGTPWFDALEKHFGALISKAQSEGKYTPSNNPQKGPLGRRYAFEAFPKYAEARAEVWLTTKASLLLIVQNIKEPRELRAAIQNQKESYEMQIQKKGQTFGYINEFPSPWVGNFPLPDGPIRKKIDEATGIPSSFDKAFPEMAAILREIP